MKKIGIIGRVADGQELYDGQTVLTRMFRDEICNQISDLKLVCVDTYRYKKNILKCLIKTIYCLLVCDEIFILLSKNGLSFYLPFLYYTNKIFKKKIYHRVIGGRLQDLVIENPNWKKYLNSMIKNYVETQSMKKSLNELGIKNVEVSPNFKKIPILKENELCYDSEEEPIKLCTFSRVAKEKGITDAINVIKKINRERQIVQLDIYGPIEENYKEEFDTEIDENLGIYYKGIVDSRQTVDVLKKYYLLLFPTFWKGEGFPGTLIDAFSAGVPIIATDWNYNDEIIENGITGFIYDHNKKELLEERIIFAINNKELIYNMKKNCIKEAEKYNPEIVIRKILDDLENSKRN